MKKLTILKSIFTLAFLVLGIAAAFAQPSTIAGVNSETLSRHGYNSAGAAVASENTDSVTTGSVMRYYVLPDATANGSYTSPLTGTLTSTFAWTTTNPVGAGTPAGTIAQVGAIAFGNYRQVTWSGTGTIDLNAQENSATCTGPLTSIPVAIIPAPTATFGLNPTAVCTNNPVQTFTLPITVTTAVNDLPITPNGFVRINYTVFNPDNTELIAAQDLNMSEATANISVTLTGATQYGTYYVIINSVTDRISRKPATDVTGAIADNRIDMVVNRTPVTGPIYHIPNM